MGGFLPVRFRTAYQIAAMQTVTVSGRIRKSRFGEANGDERTLVAELSTADSDLRPAA